MKGKGRRRGWIGSREISLSLSLSWFANETLFIRVPRLGLHKTPLLVEEEVLLRGPFLHDKIRRRVTTDRPKRAHSETAGPIAGLWVTWSDFGGKQTPFVFPLP